jgi:aminoglycoside phosphotransferase family enzyme
MPHPVAPAIDTDTLLAFLQDPASYPHRPEHVELVQTHASYVALAGDTVYKVKKPVNLGFLDFSTLKKRHHFCHEEVRLNRRLCTDLYEGVVAIQQTPSGLAFAGDEAPDQEPALDYAVRMKRLPDEAFLLNLLHRGALRADHLDRIAERLADFYAGQTPAEAVSEWGAVDRLRVSTDENFEQTAAFVGDLITPPAYDVLRSYTDRFYADHAALFERRRAGHILDCHGDLHLDHIHLTDERVCIYDCIEFNERFRYIDVANDVAFLAMDLDFNDRPDLARYFIERLTRLLDDPDLPRLATFYQCYRAYVRG